MGTRNQERSQDQHPKAYRQDASGGVPLIIFHGLADALAAVVAAEKSGAPIRLITAPGAAGYAGVGWFLEIAAHIQRQQSERQQSERQQKRVQIDLVLDCGAEPGLALGAIRAGVKRLRLMCQDPVRETIARIAIDHDVVLFEPAGPALDLQFSDDAEAACCAWIAQNPRPDSDQDRRHKGAPKQGRPQLYVITPPHIAEPVAFADLLATVLENCVDDIVFLQLRIKSAVADSSSALLDDTISAVVNALKPVCSHYRLPLILNDDPRLAAELACDGAHIGAEDVSYQQARAVLGPHKIIGVSCYAGLPRARQAEADGADYVAFGAFFPSRFKPQPRATPSPTILQKWKQQSTLPAAAIGGITAENVHPLIQAGADYLCAIGAIWEHPCGPATAVRGFIDKIDQALQE